METEQSAFAVDDSRFPLVEVTFPVIATEASIDAYCGDIDALAARGRFFIVADFRRVDLRSVKPKIRLHFSKASAEWTKSAGKGKMLGEAIVLTHPIARFMLTAFSWMHGERNFPSQTFTRIGEARAWACESIRSAGLEVCEASSGLPI